MDLVKELEQRLELEVDKLIEQEDIVERLRQALQVLKPSQDYQTRLPALGSLESQPRIVDAPPPSPQRPPEPVDTRIHCNACGGRMESSIRTLQSGKTYPVLVCTDSGCNNEQF